jgi:hypothetical protein
MVSFIPSNVLIVDPSNITNEYLNDAEITKNFLLEGINFKLKNRFPIFTIEMLKT